MRGDHEGLINKRGRPVNRFKRELITRCRKQGCNRPPATGQAYCSRDHAPLGNYGYGFKEVDFIEDDEDYLDADDALSARKNSKDS